MNKKRAFARLEVRSGYETLATVLNEALLQAQAGKGHIRHSIGEPFCDQQIMQIGEWMQRSTAFAIGQACKEERTHDADDMQRPLQGDMQVLPADRSAVPVPAERRQAVHRRDLRRVRGHASTAA